MILAWPEIHSRSVSGWGNITGMDSVAGPVSASGGAGVCSDCGSCARETAGKKNVLTAIIEAKQYVITVPAATLHIIESFRPFKTEW